tara:strand:+ start:734 stop:991 length:258 start_codon:yes stop_codon:yes gene_type:complete
MDYMVRVNFEYSGDSFKGHTQIVKTTHYYRMDGNIILHVNKLKTIGLVDEVPPSYDLFDISEEEFNESLKTTIEKLGINPNKHKF